MIKLNCKHPSRFSFRRKNHWDIFSPSRSSRENNQLSLLSSGQFIWLWFNSSLLYWWTKIFYFVFPLKHVTDHHWLINKTFSPIDRWIDRKQNQNLFLCLYSSPMKMKSLWGLEKKFRLTSLLFLTIIHLWFRYLLTIDVDDSSMTFIRWEIFFIHCEKEKQDQWRSIYSFSSNRKENNERTRLTAHLHLHHLVGYRCRFASFLLLLVEDQRFALLQCLFQCALTLMWNLANRYWNNLACSGVKICPWNKW